MKKFVIYSVITGGYEEVLQPLVVDDRFDYVLFTDNEKKGNKGVWSIKQIRDDPSLDKIRLSRFPKSHPESLLSEYVASLYIDANVQIKDSWIYSRFVDLVNNNVEYAGIKLVLTGRDCIYDHAFDMCTVHVEHDYIGIKQCHELFLRKFPQHFGLNENNVIFRMHTKRIKEMDCEWWNWIVNFSCRDQFSFMYCLWKYGIPIHFILPEGEDARNSSHFNCIVHNNKPIVSKRKIKKKSIFEKTRLVALSINPHDGLKIWTKSYKSKYPVMTLYVLSFFVVLKNLPLLFHRLLNKFL